MISSFFLFFHNVIKYDYTSNQIHTHGSKQSYSQESGVSHGSCGSAVTYRPIDVGIGGIGGGIVPPLGPAYTDTAILSNKINAMITASIFLFMINFPFHRL